VIKDFRLFNSKSSTLIAPYGGKLIDLMVPVEGFEERKAYASQLPSIQISPRSVCDLELLATGAYSPLDRFMGREDHQRVLDEMRLADGHIFPIPITLPVNAHPDLRLDQDIALRSSEQELLAIMTIEEIYHWDRVEVADKVFGAQDSRHAFVSEMRRWGSLNISGRLQVLHLPQRFDFQELRLTPSQTRAKLANAEDRHVVAISPHQTLHRIDEDFIEKTVQDVDGILLLQLVAGLARLGDVDHFTRISLFKALVERYQQPDRVLLTLLPLAGREAGLRETLWQALIHRNFGADRMIVGGNHLTPKVRSNNTHSDSLQEAREWVEKYTRELGVKIMPEQPEQLKPSSNGGQNAPLSGARTGVKVPQNGKTLPNWYTQRDLAEIVAETHQPRHRQGVCIWFTGLSGSGKSTTAEMLTWLLLAQGRRVTVLDGDVVRTHLSKGLGFSKEDRDTNVRRIGYVASELVRYGAVVICAVVSPYRAARNDVRHMVGDDQFVEVFVDTPLEVCESRDVKGYYAKARRGEIKGFTGIDDPYEPPHYPEIVLDTTRNSPQENAGLIIDYLHEQGFVRLAEKPDEHKLSSHR
jgi:sulfate adenylyltransferase